MLSKINNPSGQKFPKFAIFSVKISFFTNNNKIYGISVLFYAGKSFIKLLLYFQFLFIERAVNTLVVLILNHLGEFGKNRLLLWKHLENTFFAEGGSILVSKRGAMTDFREIFGF